MAVRADDVDLTRDRSLVELCQAGDEKAFGDLYNRYYRRLLRFCIRRVGNVHDAEEITQETFARAFNAMPRFAGERRFYPWLTVIASRLCIDSHRRGARTEPAAEVDLGSVEGGQQAIVDNVDIAYLAEAMHRLGPRHREVLTLREAHGWTYQQIADHYSVTMGTVEALLFRARKALRREFLAIAGEDHALAAVPILGVVIRSLSAFRDRVQDVASHISPAAAAATASVAAMAGGIALAAPAHSSDAQPVTHSAPHVVRLPIDTATSTLAPVTSEVGSAAHAVNPSSPVARSQKVQTLSQESATEAHQKTADDSAKVTVAGLTISTDLANLTHLLGLK